MTKRVDRRHFLQTSAAGLAGFGFVRNLPTVFSAQPPTTSQRHIIPLNRRWLFSDKPSPRATHFKFDDSGFERVAIPHTNRRLPLNGFDDKSYQFVSVYRRHFKLPENFVSTSGTDGRGGRALQKHVFVDFAGVMTAATVYLNGKQVGEHRGGYTPFSFELTPHLNWKTDNVLVVEVDSTERPDIPPFGGNIDYLTFGGIYRDVSLRIVADRFIENVFAKPVNVLAANRSVDVRCFLNTNNEMTANYGLEAELRDGDRIIAKQDREISTRDAYHDITLSDLGTIELWDLEHPKRYEVRVRLYMADQVIDHYNTRIGFREARFTKEGFFLNGKHLKLRGLNRHQTFPYVGQAMPARVQKRDAFILKRELKCNIVRTSHYPQSPHFLGACDELGLLVFEEIPGWNHIGDEKWKESSVQNVEAMIRRDWNHPSIILWGVRINESPDDHQFYTHTNQVAHGLDDSRQTAGVRMNYDSELLEDVFTMNDFGFPLKPPREMPYLNTEFVGHTYPTKQNDNVERVMEQTMRHARVHNQIASDKRYTGGLGWCAFDYHTHANFGSGDRICYHGVSDIFRLPKPAAGFYRSQCDPKEEIILEPAFHWARGDRNRAFDLAMICSNCEHLKLYIGDRLVAEVEPDRQNFQYLPYPPFVVDLKDAIRGAGWGDLRIEGYIGARKVISKTLSGKGIDQQFHADPDDSELLGDGIDTTRVVLRVTDEFGAQRPFAVGAIGLSIEGPGEIIGDNPFALVGGVGAVWVRTKEASGVIRLNAKHPTLGVRRIDIQVRRVGDEEV
jgi:beta-galactosidase